MNYTTYDAQTGKIFSVVTGTGDDLIATLGTNAYIPGQYDGRKYYIDITTQQAVLKGNNPGPFYAWDDGTHTWIKNTDAEIAYYRNTRDNMLSKFVDKVNPIWYASLTSEQQTELQTYRTALLNVPEQSGWPSNIIWPTPPSWLNG